MNTPSISKEAIDMNTHRTLMKSVFDATVAEAVAIINECREEGESDLRTARDRIRYLELDDIVFGRNRED